MGARALGSLRYLNKLHYTADYCISEISRYKYKVFCGFKRSCEKCVTLPQLMSHEWLEESEWKVQWVWRKKWAYQISVANNTTNVTQQTVWIVLVLGNAGFWQGRGKCVIDNISVTSPLLLGFFKVLFKLSILSLILLQEHIAKLTEFSHKDFLLCRLKKHPWKSGVLINNTNLFNLGTENGENGEHLLSYCRHDTLNAIWFEQRIHISCGHAYIYRSWHVIWRIC